MPASGGSLGLEIAKKVLPRSGMECQIVTGACTKSAPTSDLCKRSYTILLGQLCSHQAAKALQLI